MTIKLVVFDFDRTVADIPAQSTWELIDRALNCEEEDRSLNQAYHSGKIDYASWSRETVELYKRYGLNKRKFEEIMQAYVRPMEGTQEVFDTIRRNGKKTAIVSGSILNVYDFLRNRYGIKADYVSFASEIFFDDKGNITGGNFTHYDYEGKVEAIKKICEQEGISIKEECAMIGDSHNDIFAFREVSLPIAFNSKDQGLEEEAKFAIKEKNLRKILPLVWIFTAVNCAGGGN